MLTDEAFVALYLAHAGELRAYFCRHQQEREAADLTQDVFLRAWDSRARFQEGTNGRAWLYRIAHNLLVDTHRRYAGRGTADVDEHAHWLTAPAYDEPEVRALRRERRRAVRATLRQLTAKQRLALWQHDALEEPIRLGPERAMRKHRVHMGRQAFRKRYPRQMREAA